MLLRFRHLLVVSTLMGLLALAAAAQVTEYPDFDVSQHAEYRQALQLASRGQATEAIQLLKTLAAQNPRTTLGAVSLFRAASTSGTESVRRGFYSQIINEYPRSRFEIFAREALINMDTGAYPRNDALCLEKYDQLVQSFGGASLASVLRGEKSAEERVKALSREMQKGLEPVYNAMSYILDNVGRRNDALTVALFQRNQPNFSGDSGSRIRYLLFEKKFGEWTGYKSEPRVNPVVRFLKPKNNNRVGTRPKIQWETTAGGWRRPQVTLSRVTVTLDGIDVRNQLTISNKVDSQLRSGPDAIFERIRFTFRPSQPLPFGRHTLLVTVPTGGYSGTGPGQTQARLDFNVSKSERYEDDECEDERENHLSD